MRPDSGPDATHGDPRGPVASSSGGDASAARSGRTARERRRAELRRRRLRARRRAGLGFAALAAAVFLAVAAGITLSRPPARGGVRIALYQGASALGGARLALSDVVGQGRPAVVNFWGSNCPPCRLEMPAFQRVYDETDGRSYVMLGVDVGRYVGLGTEEGARRFLREQGIRYPAGASLDDAPLDAYGIRALPTTLFFDAGGSLVGRSVGYLPEDRFRDHLDALLGTAAAPAAGGSRARR